MIMHAITVHLLPYNMKVLRQKSFMWFLHVAKLFYMKVQDDTNLRESMWDSRKFFCKGLRVQLAGKLICLETYMVYSTHTKLRMYFIVCLYALLFIIYTANYMLTFCRIMSKLFHECENHIKEDHLLLRLLVFLCSEDDIDIMLSNAPFHIVALHVADLWNSINKLKQVPNLNVGDTVTVAPA